ncbi:MAG: DUF488 family protein [Bryobacteraceae bacterium]
MPFRLKRAYDPPAADDGYRVLIDRLWARGLTREAAAVDLWFKEIAPSNELRKWFGHDPAQWDEFLLRYARELAEHPESLEKLLAMGEGRTVTLLYSTRETERNHGVALLGMLKRRGG